MGIIADQAFRLRHRDKIFVGGDWVSPSTSALIDVINPSNEEIVVQVAEAQASDMDRAVAAARAAFDEGPWPRLTHAERAMYLRAIANGIRSRREQFAAIQSSQMGIPFRQSLAVAPWTADLYDYYADRAEDYPFIERHKAADGGFGLLVREPVGVVGAIIPWNGPMTLIAPKLAPALLAGCTVIVKASPEAPGEAYCLAEIIEEIGLPAGVVNIVTAHRAVSELLVRDPRVDKISFTGSSSAGKKIASIMGERIGRFTLELGGKSAAVILDDYDMATAATALAAEGARMTGQVCAALTRIIVPRKRHDDFIEALTNAFAATKVGDPFDPETEMGPLATSRQRDIVERYIAIGKQQGAKLAAGGGRPEHINRGFFVEPTVFANVENSHTIAQEEIFGPVLSVIPADDDRHAISIANDSVYGLNGAVFSKDIERSYNVARQLRSGTVGHNGFRADFGIAFGGFKQSGLGREGGREGIHPYLEMKTMILDREPEALSKSATS